MFKYVFESEIGYFHKRPLRRKILRSLFGIQLTPEFKEKLMERCTLQRFHVNTKGGFYRLTLTLYEEETLKMHTVTTRPKYVRTDYGSFYLREIVEISNAERFIKSLI